MDCSYEAVYCFCDQVYGKTIFDKRSWCQKKNHFKRCIWLYGFCSEDNAEVYAMPHYTQVIFNRVSAHSLYQNETLMTLTASLWNRHLKQWLVYVPIKINFEGFSFLFATWPLQDLILVWTGLHFFGYKKTMKLSGSPFLFFLKILSCILIWDIK